MYKTSYSEKLKDPRWQKKRLKILERDKWRCVYCGDTGETLHVHHLFYIPKYEPWDIPNGLLITLCESCHKPGPCEGATECARCVNYMQSNCEGYFNPPQQINDMVAVLLNALWKRADPTGNIAPQWMTIFSWVHHQIKTKFDPKFMVPFKSEGKGFAAYLKEQKSVKGE